jgi:hypothetical protein
MTQRRCNMEWTACENHPRSVPSERDGMGVCADCGSTWPAGHCPNPGVEQVQHLWLCSTHTKYAKSVVRSDAALDVFEKVFGLVFYVGLPVGAVYLLVRFIHWAWETPITR